MSKIKNYIKKLHQLESLEHSEAAELLKLLISGCLTPAQISAVVSAYNFRFLTGQEISGFCEAANYKRDNYTVNFCGTKICPKIEIIAKLLFSLKASNAIALHRFNKSRHLQDLLGALDIDIQVAIPNLQVINFSEDFRLFSGEDVVADIGIRSFLGYIFDIAAAPASNIIFFNNENYRQEDIAASLTAAGYRRVAIVENSVISEYKLGTRINNFNLDLAYDKFVKSSYHVKEEANIIRQAIAGTAKRELELATELTALAFYIAGFFDNIDKAKQELLSMIENNMLGDKFSQISEASIRSRVANE